MKGLSKFVKRDTYEKVMFGWVHGLRLNLPACSVAEAIENFLKHNKIEDDMGVMNVQSLSTTYHRMVKEYFNEQKTNTSDNRPITD